MHPQTNNILLFLSLIFVCHTNTHDDFGDVSEIEQVVTLGRSRPHKFCGNFISFLSRLHNSAFEFLYVFIESLSTEVPH